MKSKVFNAVFVILALLLSGASLACDFKQGETRFEDYANCRYGEDAIEVVELAEGSTWEKCIYQVEAFRPAKLLAVTKMKDGKEVLSINDRSKIGNPCYMTKRQCDTALKAAGY